MLHFILFTIGFFSTFSIAFVFTRDRDLALLLSPALLLAAATLVFTTVVRHHIPLGAAWSSIWLVVAFATAAGIIHAFQKRRPFPLAILLTPVISAAIVMAPYIIHGISHFPGSWFWDGFTYMAAGESLWLHPRNADLQGLELFYEFGHRAAQSRYISSAFIGTLKGIFPPNGDAQSAIGYFLLLSVFTFATSSFFLARVVLIGRPLSQVAFVIVASISGPVLNLIWANNFDHLLALSIAPVLIALAYWLKWGSWSDALLLALFAVVEIIIYPEMAALFLLPAALLLIVRLVDEQDRKKQTLTAVVGLATTAALLFPIWTDLYAFLVNQIDAVVHASATARPGAGHFLTFFSPLCAPSTVLGLFGPFSTCTFSFGTIAKLTVSVGCFAVLLLAIRAERRQIALLATMGFVAAGAGYYLIVQHYDYGAFKILESAWPSAVLLAFIVTLHRRSEIRIVAACIAAFLVVIAVLQISGFEAWAPVKSIAPYAIVESKVPRDGVVEVAIDDTYAFQWATYYLRNHRAVYSRGELAYFPASETDKSGNAERMKEVRYLLTDKSQEKPSQGSPLWSNGIYFLYRRTN